MTRTASLTAEQVHKALHASKLDSSAIDVAQRSYHRHLEHKDKGVSPAGWHGAGDIVTLVGLAGDYFWSEDPLRPSQMHLKFDAGYEGYRGTYRLSHVSGGVPQEGVFYCVPNNPAIGWALVSLVPNDGSEPRPFIVSGMLTDASWKIWVLMLNKVDAKGPVEPPFSVVRFL